ncbi:MAG: hypothetical protein AB2L18_06410 [Anaerolineaceae bacterium]
MRGSSYSTAYSESGFHTDVDLDGRRSEQQAHKVEPMQAPST